MSTTAAIAKGKKCDKRCEARNAEYSQQLISQRILEDPNVARKIFITFATPTRGGSGNAEFLKTVRSVSDSCIQQNAELAQRIFNDTVNGNRLINNTWSSIIARLVTVPMDLLTSQVAGNIVEKALNSLLAGKTWNASRFMIWNSYKAEANVLTICA